MFTGLVLEMGEITSIKKRPGGIILSLRSPEVHLSAELGDSISINGVCLTVVKKEGKKLSFDLSEETLSRTNLGGLKAGDIVNIEPSLTPQAKLGGHFVTGHIDTVGKIRAKVHTGDMLKIEFEAPPGVTKFLVEKGSVAVDGISLTVVDILKDGFTVVIIPHTARLTTLGFKGPGDKVNIEADILGKYVAKFLGRDSEADRDKDRDISLMKTLLKEGYI
jgi:riboflavin synthase